jgi:hypothetical protein
MAELLNSISEKFDKFIAVMPSLAAMNLLMVFVATKKKIKKTSS